MVKADVLVQAAVEVQEKSSNEAVVQEIQKTAAMGETAAFSFVSTPCDPAKEGP